MVLTLAPLQLFKTFFSILDLGSSNEYKSSGERFDEYNKLQKIPLQPQDNTISGVTRVSSLGVDNGK
jgi:hypothetical protein